MRRIFLILTIFLLVTLWPITPTHAEFVASFTSEREVVTPLNPVLIYVNVQDYSGPAQLLIFDADGRAAGVFDLQLDAGYGAVRVQPRGSLGPHWGALFVNGTQVYAATIYTLDASTTVQTGVPAFDTLYAKVQDFMAHDRLSYRLDGTDVVGYRSPDSPLLWLRDHYYQNRAFRYFETDLKSLPEAFARAQAEDGSFPDFLARPEWQIPALRTPVEADVEYLYVQLIYETWQTTGDRDWMLKMLPSAQRAIAYTLTSPIRWEPHVGLVMRPFTIDTWDFEYGPTTTDPDTGRPAPRHWIDAQTKWGIFHGDNTGLAEALRSLAVMEQQAGLWESAYERNVLADQIMQRLNHLSWNGNFYTHHVKLIPYDVPGVDEAKQLSLSNALALNRGVLSVEQGQAIVGEYLRRLQAPGRVAFAEWWSIDPPFPAGAFGLDGRLGERPGEYVNGGVMPLVGGELARGAFRYGYEVYGFDILDRYATLIRRSNATYLWYYPTGGIAPVNEYLATDGWGASAMLGALIEGAAGIEDYDPLLDSPTISPRWPASPRDRVHDAYVVARYAASNAYVAYRWSYQPAQKKGGIESISIEATGSGSGSTLRILLPATARSLVTQVILNGQSIPIQIETIGLSRYVIVPTSGPIVQVQVRF